jgi:hypothetical protein
MAPPSGRRRLPGRWAGLDHAKWVQTRTLSGERNFAVGRRLEREVAELVLGNVDGATEPDARFLSRRRFGRGSSPSGRQEPDETGAGRSTALAHGFVR